jgi:hypothetical protein
MAKDYSGTPLGKKLGAAAGKEVLVFFTTRRDELQSRLPALKETLGAADGLWIAWPKKASTIETDLDFAAVQQAGLDAGLVDNKSCAIDGDWQALRFVYRLSDRSPRVSRSSGARASSGSPRRATAGRDSASGG